MLLGMIVLMLYRRDQYTEARAAHDDPTPWA
jgi:hypothetical protein